MTSKGRLLLVPNTLGSDETAHVIPAGIADQITGVGTFLVENPKTARKLLIGLGLKDRLDNLEMISLKKGIDPADLKFIEDEWEAGKDVAVLSDAGCAGIADPGQEIVRHAHRKQVRVIPLTGPSSILLALMASGFNGQSFAFNGYLPVDQIKRKKAIRMYERKALSESQTQIFIETPYRNAYLLNDLLSECQKKTKICVAFNLTLPDEWIRAETVDNWKNIKPDFHKKPCIFLIYK